MRTQKTNQILKGYRYHTFLVSCFQ